MLSYVIVFYCLGPADACDEAGGKHGATSPYKVKICGPRKAVGFLGMVSWEWLLLPARFCRALPASLSQLVYTWEVFTIWHSLYAILGMNSGSQTDLKQDLFTFACGHVPVPTPNGLFYGKKWTAKSKRMPNSSAQCLSPPLSTRRWLTTLCVWVSVVQENVLVKRQEREKESALTAKVFSLSSFFLSACSLIYNSKAVKDLGLSRLGLD